LAAFGIEIGRKEGDTFHIAGDQHYQATTYVVEGDWSAASCWLTAAALGADISIEGLSPSSAQADKQMLAALMSAGCSVHFTPDGIRVNGSKKHPFEFNAQDCPDLFPALVALAAHIPGSSIIHGANRLIHKESNRAEALILEFQKLGVLIEQKENALYIHGKSSLAGNQVDAHNDHRIAMALGVCGLFCQGPMTIYGAESVSKSYPEFWDTLDSLAH
jgi:3-phosphoshikimate 1-carboxyvinyltransferase